MRFDMKKPCADCPFLREGGIRLARARAAQIAENAVDWQGATFACHKTVDYDADDEDTRDESGERHCAGALIFSIKNGSMTQMMRIMHRVGAFDPRLLMEDSKVTESTFDSIDEMVEANERFFSQKE